MIPRRGSNRSPASYRGRLLPEAAFGSLLLSLTFGTLQPATADGPASTSPEGASGDAKAEADASGSGEERLLPDWGRSRLAESGIDFQVTYVGEVLGNVAGGLRTGAVYEGLVKLGVDLDTERLDLWSAGSFHGSMLYPHGPSLSTDYVGDLFTFSNIDAPDSVRLFEVWYEHAVVPEHLTVRVGQLAADEEFAGTEPGSTFVNGTCGWPAIIAANVPSPAYPVATPGIRLAAAWGQGWSFRTAVYNGQPSPVDANGESLNEHGVEMRIQDALVMAEAQKDWSLAPAGGGLPGRAKLGSWYHSGTFVDQHDDTTGRSLADPNTSGQPRELDGNWGVYAALEQQLTREPDGASADQGLELFSRLGASPSHRNQVDLYAEGGLVYTGLLPHRDADALGVAVVFGRMSQDARILGQDRNRQSPTPVPLPDYEMVLETTYRFALANGLALQPIVAAILHPGGSSAIDDALVLGVRATIDF